MKVAMTLDEQRTGAPALHGLRVAVVGLGRSGLAAARFLAARGARVTGSDRRSREELGEAAVEMAGLGIALETGGHGDVTFAKADLVIVSPGVPLETPALAAARAAGVPLWAEVELAARFLRGILIGVTGSNGKSTVTALTAHLLAAAGIDAVACGNIGRPLVSLVDGDREDRRYVVELSSFQLEGIERFRPRVAVLTNLSPDHQDRYREPGEYYAAKERIFRNQGPEDDAVLNADDPAVAAMVRGAGGPRRHAFSTAGPVENGAFLAEGILYLVTPAGRQAILPAGEVPLVGRHNLENALAACLAAALAGAPADALRDGLRSFRGLPHRMEPVAEIGGVLWLNDSKATNPAATARVVESVDRPLVLILGGRDKGADFASLRPVLAGRVRRLILMGEARHLLRREIGDAAESTSVETMEEAVAAARSCAAPGDAVLLAPACASFDQYANFEQRGEHFRTLVRKLAEEAGNG